MANKRSGKYDYSAIDGLAKWTKEKLGLERGVDYSINPRFDPKTGKVKVILLKPQSKKAKDILHKTPKILADFGGVVDVDVANDGALFVRFAKKQTRGTKRGSPVKKRAVHKVGYRKLSSRKSASKRYPKLRLPRNSSKKPHIVTMINLLNSFRDAQRAECVSILSKFQPNGSSAKKAVIKFKKRRILTAKARRQLITTVMKIFKENKD